MPRGTAEAWEEVRAAEDVPEGAVGACVSLDGVMVPVREETNGSLTTRYREASCGTVNWFDGAGAHAGEEQGDAQGTVDGGTGACARHIDIVAIADGARDNQGWLDGITEHTLVDYWHVCQHLARDAVGGRGEAWYRRCERILLDDPRGADKVLRSLRHYRKAATTAGHAETLREVVTCVGNNRHRMACRRWRDLSRPSGIVEAANKTLVTRPMKLSGQRWNHEGGQAVLTWRSLHFDAAWQHVTARLNPHSRASAANDNGAQCRVAA